MYAMSVECVCMSVCVYQYVMHMCIIMETTRYMYTYVYMYLQYAYNVYIYHCMNFLLLGWELTISLVLLHNEEPVFAVHVFVMKWKE